MSSTIWRHITKFVFLFFFFQFVFDSITLQIVPGSRTPVAYPIFTFRWLAVHALVVSKLHLKKKERFCRRMRFFFLVVVVVVVDIFQVRAVAILAEAGARRNLPEAPDIHDHVFHLDLCRPGDGTWERVCSRHTWRCATVFAKVLAVAGGHPNEYREFQDEGESQEEGRRDSNLSFLCQFPWTWSCFGHLDEHHARQQRCMWQLWYLPFLLRGGRLDRCRMFAARYVNLFDIASELQRRQRLACLEDRYHRPKFQ